MRNGRLSLSFVIVVVAAACQKSPGETPVGHTTEKQSPSVKIADVSWPNPGTIDRLVLAQLPAGAQAKVASSSVPVLVPNDPQLLAAGVLVVDAHWYSFNAKVGGLTVTVAGNRAEQVVEGFPKLQPNRSMRGTQGFVTNNEGIEQSSWIERNVAYTVDVECFDRDDARCTGDAFTLQLTDGLKFVGPAGPGNGGAP